MDYTIVALPEMRIVGPTITTSNDAPDVVEKIGGLWQGFMEGAKYALIEDVTAEPYACFGAYYEYDFAANAYTMMVGCESEGGAVPDGMREVTVPSGKYAKFTVQGDQVQAVVQGWNEIWAMDDLAKQRAYTVDFEAYYPAEDMSDATIDLFIALK